MPAAAKRSETPANTSDPELLDALSEAVESGAGLPAVARAAARLLDASVALIDRSSAVLAVAGASSDQEKKLLSGGDGARWNVRLHYSYEGPTPLETGGGIRHALPLLGDAPFIGVAADIVSDIDYGSLAIDDDALAHLVMVPNPPFHPRGDFSLDASRLNEDDVGERLTFSSVAVYRPALVANEPDGAFKLLPLFRRAMRDRKLSGERFDGYWRNVGTPEQLREAAVR